MNEVKRRILVELRFNNDKGEKTKAELNLSVTSYFNAIDLLFGEEHDPLQFEVTIKEMLDDGSLEMDGDICYITPKGEDDLYDYYRNNGKISTVLDYGLSVTRFYPGMGFVTMDKLMDT